MILEAKFQLYFTSYFIFISFLLLLFYFVLLYCLEKIIDKFTGKIIKKKYKID